MKLFKSIFKKIRGKKDKGEEDKSSEPPPSIPVGLSAKTLRDHNEENNDNQGADQDAGAGGFEDGADEEPGNLCSGFIILNFQLNILDFCFYKVHFYEVELKGRKCIVSSEVDGSLTILYMCIDIL